MVDVLVVVAVKNLQLATDLLSCSEYCSKSCVVVIREVNHTHSSALLRHYLFVALEVCQTTFDRAEEHHRQGIVAIFQMAICQILIHLKLQVSHIFVFSSHRLTPQQTVSISKKPDSWFGLEETGSDLALCLQPMWSSISMPRPGKYPEWMLGNVNDICLYPSFGHMNNVLRARYSSFLYEWIEGDSKDKPGTMSLQRTMAGDELFKSWKHKCVYVNSSLLL
ncbi:hypothetical protein JOB18_020244 [Solea senegalensis]|uniref:Uncharacterized protein n=1 Tax=Solea senegalensis TaxID=28829 RepID=A0AAV6T6L9_SOLSE|nr:hypothetical protein JOB18_020244 [Solea senegalensis]